jgi:hypothetical protein
MPASPFSSLLRLARYYRVITNAFPSMSITGIPALVRDHHEEGAEDIQRCAGQTHSHVPGSLMEESSLVVFGFLLTKTELSSTIIHFCIDCIQ